MMIMVFIGLSLRVVSEPTVLRNPNRLSYYPGEYVMLMCVLEDDQVDEPVEYRWSSTSVMSQLDGNNLTGSNWTLSPRRCDAGNYTCYDGNYTCYANTNNTYTKESQGITTTVTVLSKLLNATKQQAARCML